MTNDRCWRFLLVQYIINCVQYRHVHFIFLIDLTHTLGSIISLGDHFHLQLRCLHGISFTDHGSESTVTAEPGISGNQQIAKVDGVGDIPLQPVASTKLRIYSIAFEINTAWKLSPYFIPWQIPAAIAYTFFSTAAYSIPVTSLQKEFFKY